ncbi:hypothetical protein [Azospirillum picis]|uniref:Uncharacterized protein n=1 Tax=Azospirillum picis TaxID=488438 RepID=A0ABU0MSE3_9PROT|nr:hypothetical protein [Azospirillum picis]MBP2301962.1 hypothetical protein [Azospirillum picis]MDQ0536411.1 hypothetical protein [Azospirillum picis]
MAVRSKSFVIFVIILEAIIFLGWFYFMKPQVEKEHLLLALAFFALLSTASTFIKLIAKYEKRNSKGEKEKLSYANDMDEWSIMIDLWAKCGGLAFAISAYIWGKIV